MAANKVKRYEVDLYKPIQQHFKKLGYDVYGEVNDCDLTAVKENELIIVELKLHLNIELLVQAAKRQRITDQVYIAVPKPSYNLRSKKWMDICHLIKRLELGLILVSFQKSGTTMEIKLHPGEFNRKRSLQQGKKKRIALLSEIKGRHGDYNIGGSSNTKIMTAYKEACIHIARCLERYGPLSPKILRQMGTGDKTLSILNKNYYGWFERVKRGTYYLTKKGEVELREFVQVIQYFDPAIEEAGASLVLEERQKED
ncbi:DUF2161 domain-containing phosphodiesterase [Heyndrickxia acidicola]|uniref:DUF2161 family putative PD-(D/E)XK-type phosphodiesterase n=1 Tax=Heyndrickxia acidicola TaxID=209389 RepID=A0ABU6MPG5_9BACI|nr:DUF2161 family putative PD-(D/E)XK-type phosphodiesterase [Heyndrickxia acidicola]MED1205528.1 DUF2161 family putative PD-(D/E)XK-type phosphodiesterase [Heyndrickxia acidicola]